MVLKGLLVKSVDLRTFRRPIFPQLVGAAGALRQIDAGFSGLFQPVGALHANIVLLRLADFMVQFAGNRQDRGRLDRMGQFGGRFRPLFLKLQLSLGLGGFFAGGFAFFLAADTGFLVDHTPFQLFPVFGRRCILPHRRSVRLTVFGPVMLLQTATVLLGVSEPEARGFLPAHMTASDFLFPG